MRLNFKFFTGDASWETYGGKFVSRKLNNGDFDYWLVMEIINWLETVGESEAPATYHVCVSVVAHSECPEDEFDRARESVFCGVPKEVVEKNQLMQVELLHSYGISVPIWIKDGNNLRNLMREARKKASFLGSFLFGITMCRPINAIGTTGWEMIRGDLLAPINKLSET